METKTTTSESAFRFSRFGSVRSKCAVDTTLAQFVDEIRSDVHRAKVEEYRRLKAQPGHEAEAKRIKDNLPCVTPSAVCFGGHAVSDLRTYSGLLCVDLDHTDSRTDDICRLAAALPYVAVVFRSVSGCGVKIFVHIRPDDLSGGFAPLYAAVGSAVSHGVGHPYDEKCGILTQPCYYSWDPQAYYNPQAEAFALPSVPPAASPAPAPPAVPSPAGTPAAAVSHPTSADPGFLQTFLLRFEQEYPFRPGSRNDIALRLGRQARGKGFSMQELEKIILVYSSRHAMPDFNEQDIRERVISGYQYVKKKQADDPAGDRVHFGSRVHYGPSTERDTSAEEAEMSEKDDELRAAAPCIPEAVYDSLHPVLQHCTETAVHPRERDILLLGSLTCLSALLPGVRFFYRDRYYSPQLYLAVVAPAGSGKGSLGCLDALLEPTVEHYEHCNRELRRKYEDDKLAWENELRQALKEKRKPDTRLRPEPPVFNYFRLPATTSRSRLIESLAAAPRTGCILFSTEIATLSAAFAQDYGNFEDIFLKAYHHEEVASSFKIDGEPKRARRPCLAACLSGTPEQFGGLFRTLEAGLFSRFTFYTRAQDIEWENCAPGTDNVDRERRFRQIGEVLFRLHQRLLESPTVVGFTPDQWEEHTRYFSDQMSRLQAEGCEAVGAILVRCGLQAMRMAAVMTALRKCDDWPDAREVTCTDNDFRAAMQIAVTTLEHSLLLSSSLPGSEHRLQALRRPRLMELVLGEMPEKFSYTDFVEVSEANNVPRTTAKRWLRNLQKKNFIEKQEDGYIKVKNLAR